MSDSQAIQQWIQKNGVTRVPQGVRTYTEHEMRQKVRGVNVPRKERDLINERFTQRMSDGRVITVNGMGEPCN